MPAKTKSFKSKFVEGATVAFITIHPGSGSNLTKAKVVKVHKDGKFIMSFMRNGEEVVMDRLWSPYNATEAQEAGRRGSSYASRSEAEIWTPEHDVKLHEQTQTYRAKVLKGRLRGAMDALKNDVPMDRQTMKDIAELLTRKGYTIPT